MPDDSAESKKWTAGEVAKVAIAVPALVAIAIPLVAGAIMFSPLIALGAYMTKDSDA